MQWWQARLLLAEAATNRKEWKKIRSEEDADKVLDDYEYYLDWYEGATDDMIEMGINESQMREKKIPASYGRQ